MANRIGIRLEDKNIWERRVVLTPSDMAKLSPMGIDFKVEHFERRAFEDEAFENAGATIVDKGVTDCELVLGVKEMPLGYFREGGAYMFFSHTIKGQSYNMDLLKEMVEKKCTLIDYETVTDDQGRRLIFFGRFAGLAGMVDTLWTLGQRLKACGIETPFLDMEPTHRYPNLDSAKAAVKAVGERIASEGLPKSLAPLVFGVAGYGNVSQGAQEILDQLPLETVAPQDLEDFVANNGEMTKKVVKVVYKEEHLAQPVDDSKQFELQEYYDHPELYRSVFEPHLNLISVLVTAIYWTEQYPRLADVDQLKALFAKGTPRLIAVGDITCDVDGSVACTVRDTEPGDPCYVYNPEDREAPSGFDGPGLSVMAVGNLPAELPRDASETFSHALAPFIPELAKVNFKDSFKEARLPGPIRRAVILWNGEFTPDYEYMQEFLR
jgi:alanine dehydrogenase